MGARSSPLVTIHEPGRTPLRLVLFGSVDVGRDCDGLLLADRELSRRHLRIRAADDHVVVEDLSSTNGTFVDGGRLDHPAVLRPGQIVRFGRCHLEWADDRDAERELPALGAESRSIEHLARSTDAVALPPWLRGEGSVTVVFSDIHRWTRRLERPHEQRRSYLLELHRGVMRRHVERSGGSELATHDDGFMIAFPRAVAAGRFSVGVMRAFDAHGRSCPADALRIRIGMHCAEVSTGALDVIGAPVSLAAWIASRARGGEILASSVIRELLGPLPEIAFGTTRHVQFGDGEAYALRPIAWSVGNG